VQTLNRQTKSPLTRNQRWGFAAAWGGWTLDGMDSFIYALVMVATGKHRAHCGKGDPGVIHCRLVGTKTTRV